MPFDKENKQTAAVLKFTYHKISRAADNHLMQINKPINQFRRASKNN